MSSWIAGDEIYGESTDLRDGIAGSGCWYVLSVRTVMPVWTERPQVAEPEPQERGAASQEALACDEAVLKY